VRRVAKGILSFFVTGVFATVALMVLGWWFIFWVVVGAIILTVIGGTIQEIVLMNKEER